MSAIVLMINTHCAAQGDKRSTMPIGIGAQTPTSSRTPNIKSQAVYIFGQLDLVRRFSSIGRPKTWQRFRRYAAALP